VFTVPAYISFNHGFISKALKLTRTIRQVLPGRCKRIKSDFFFGILGYCPLGPKLMMVELPDWGKRTRNVAVLVAFE
jgi:hypothetical protein